MLLVILEGELLQLLTHEGIIADDTYARGDPQLRQLRVIERLSADLGDTVGDRDLRGGSRVGGENTVLVDLEIFGRIGLRGRRDNAGVRHRPRVGRERCRNTDRRERNNPGQRYCKRRHVSMRHDYAPCVDNSVNGGSDHATRTRITHYSAHSRHPLVTPILLTMRQSPKCAPHPQYHSPPTTNRSHLSRRATTPTCDHPKQCGL